MKGFNETVTINLPLIVDYTLEGNNLTIVRADVAGSLGFVTVAAMPETIRDEIYAQLAASIRAYEFERKTAFDDIGSDPVKDWTLQTR